MEDDDIRRLSALTALITELPRERARTGFTARVLRRLEEPHRAGVPRWRMAWAGAALLTVAVAGGGWELGQWQERRDDAEARRLVAEIKGEHARLAREVRELQEDRRPMVYLGGDESVDVVVDLSRVEPGRSGGVLPAAESSETY
jgi:hypothetical protein